MLARRRLGVPGERAQLSFGSADPKSDFTGRYLMLGGEPAFGLSSWCGTCPFHFERQGGANGTLSAGRAKVQLFALVSQDGSLASDENAARLPGLLTRPRVGRARE